MGVVVRPMVDADVEAAAQVHVAAFADLDRREGTEPQPVSDDVWARIHRRHRHFLTHDPAGSWVATIDGQVIGCALALKRETLWGLSLLAVDPKVQSSGSGRALLEASLTHAAGCDRAVIQSSMDPRAMRSYANSGFALYPQVFGKGQPDRAALPAQHGRVREGGVADADRADSIDRLVRGAPHGPDHLRIATDMPMFVIDDVDGRGYAYVRDDGQVFLLAATNDETATALLWRGIAHAVEIDKPASLYGMTAEQQWAIRTSYTARLKVVPEGPVFWRGITPPRAYLPSGAYL